MFSFSERGKIRSVGTGKAGSLRRSALRFRSYLLLILPLTANCTIVSNQPGPQRAIAIAEDVESMRQVNDQLMSGFYSSSPTVQASTRNQIITARMYMADLEYHYYEANLTREMQSEGLLATATSLGLTTTASLIPVAQTSRLLSGIATGVTGLDKAYDEKQLLSNTMQALQAQMRADRKTWAAEIQAKMLKSDKRTVTPITEYTLPMALSDADAYYQAGTIASALIGLSKTVANAETNAQQAKSDSGPNPVAVSQVRSTAHPTAHSMAPTALPVIRAVFRPDDSSAILEKFLDPDGTGMRKPERVQAITPFLTRMGLRARDLTRFLNGSEFATQRQSLIRELRDQGKL